ncbi:MAG TPA: SidA/IucD/PvdA family monooxygenase, partial [Candidatus Dormibacteraeota bacterium]|nr:SidA/IucD/PvdA family monooxygenase [Candidatus Dormibacteraeota bacterium]
MLPQTPVAIVGAGPYALSLASHLKARGVEFRIFGRPMEPWSRMHRGMGLKSPDFGTNIYTPRRGFSFVEWCRDRGISTEEPIAIDLFASYGRWAQEQLVPEVEQVDVMCIRAAPAGFEVDLANGQALLARRVVVATGLSNYARIPAELRELTTSLVSHTSRHREYDEFAGRTVAVVGGGSSAL